MKKVEDFSLYQDYLQDESLLSGRASKLYFVENTEDVEEITKFCYQNEEIITIQGGLTGICGGAVPNGGVILNVSKMNKVLAYEYDEKKDEYYLQVEAGILLQDLNQMIQAGRIIEDEKWIFAPDPTETMASLGGMIACDASGACSYGYGSVREFVEGVKIVTPFKTLDVSRGQYKYSDLVDLLELDLDQDKKEGLLKLRRHNHNLKDVAGIYYDEDMDLVDLFVGSEGIFGIITEVKIRLIRQPVYEMGIMVFLKKESDTISFVNWLRREECKENGNHKRPVAIEYFHHDTLMLAKKYRKDKIAFSALPEIRESFAGAIYVEYHFDEDWMLDKVFDELMEGIELFQLNECEQWMGVEPSDYKKLKEFRHAIPECINHLVSLAKQKDERIHKIGTDLSVEDKNLSTVMNLYEKTINETEIQTYIFGHIGNNHLHVNLIPANYEQLLFGKMIVKEWALKIIKLKGSITAEHGVGRIKKELFYDMISKSEMEHMKELRKLFDPKQLINSGVLFVLCWLVHC
jgi:D-lactate dehydrogenase (cytochrome)